MKTEDTEVGVTGLTIRAAVAESVKNVGPRTRDAVVEHFAQREAEKQAQALIKGLDKLGGLEHDLIKIRPQHTMFDATGGGVGDPTFTKEQVENRKKLTEQIEKLTKSINKADDQNDFGDLYNVVKGN
jgi:hypothetical protein